MKFKRAKIVGAVLLASLLPLAGCAGVASRQAAPPAEPTNSVELARAMGNGINLGNTMEAYGRVKFGTAGTPADYETFWGQPVTTQAIIGYFKKAGFDSIRIPVAWTNMMNYESGDYAINDAYLTRVGEIIQYALNENMYVMVNDHWDGGWWGMFGSATPQTREKAMAMYVSMWTQIAEKYKDYSDRLIFESANEELGNRLNDKDIAKDSGALSEDECYAAVNKINQAFVDTVRKTGGKNADRYLLIAGYNTDIDKTCDARFSMPTDAAKGRLLLSVHYYAPSDYCVFTGVNRWGNKDEYAQMNASFKKLSKFNEAGYGVVIGEYAVSLKDDGSVKNNTLAFLTNVLDNCDLYGYTPMLWDCSSLYKRSTLSCLDKDIADLFVERRLSSELGKTSDEIELAARLSIGSSVANAKDAVTVDPNAAVAWIMYNSGDYGASYSVGDKYNPTSKTEGLVAVDPAVTGAGTYTVSLDFTGTKAGSANSVGFSALAIANGEKLYPGYVVEIKEVKVNGAPYAIKGNPYTTSDDGTCTRVNLFNEWVTSIPKTVRIAVPEAGKPSANLLEKNTLGKVQTISITFEYRKP